MKIESANGKIKREQTVRRIRSAGGQLSQAAYSVLIHRLKLFEVIKVERIAQAYNRKENLFTDIKFSDYNLFFFGLLDGVYIGVGSDPLDKSVYNRLKDMAKNS